MRRVGLEGVATGRHGWQATDEERHGLETECENVGKDERVARMNPWPAVSMGSRLPGPKKVNAVERRHVGQPGHVLLCRLVKLASGVIGPSIYICHLDVSTLC